MSARIASSRGLVRRAAGFTLVELLVTITIIAILASVALAALAGARQMARVAATKATITKLNDLVLRKYDSYLTRRVAFNIVSGAPSPMPPLVTARVRLQALRQLMRLEMPDRYSDITFLKTTNENLPIKFQVELPDNVTGASGSTAVTVSVTRTTLAKAYFRRYFQHKPSDKYDSAELLYLMVSHMGKEALSQFDASEIGDADGDGWPEFHDAWGNPIYFLRWAPGFDDSQIQKNVVAPGLLGTASSHDLWFSTDSVQTAKSEAAANDHDPFDPRGVDSKAWRLVPLIVSAGPDGIYDLSFSATTDDPSEPYYTFQGDPYESFIGLPTDTENTSETASGPKNGSFNHYDNIHNHRLQD